MNIIIINLLQPSVYVHSSKITKIVEKLTGINCAILSKFKIQVTKPKKRLLGHRDDTSAMMFRGGSRAATTSKMECFVIIVNGFQPLTAITKRSILDVAAALDPPLMLMSSLLNKLLFPIKN